MKTITVEYEGTSYEFTVTDRVKWVTVHKLHTPTIKAGTLRSSRWAVVADGSHMVKFNFWTNRNAAVTNGGTRIQVS